MYGLLNLLKFGLKQALNSKYNLQKLNNVQLDESLTLDFMSGIFFRVVENLNSEDDDP